MFQIFKDLSLGSGKNAPAVHLGVPGPAGDGTGRFSGDVYSAETGCSGQFSDMPVHCFGLITEFEHVAGNKYSAMVGTQRLKGLDCHFH